MTNDGNKGLFLGGSQNNLQALALGTSTSEASFAINGNSAANPPIAASAAILKLPDTSPTPAIGTGATPVFVWEAGRPFLIQGWGICKTGTSANLTLKLYQVPASVVAAGLAAGSVTNCQSIAASSARAVNSTTGKFIFQAELQWDSATGLIHGCFTDTINNVLDAWAVTTAVTTATLADNELNFLMSATLSSGNAANVVTLQEFAAIQV